MYIEMINIEWFVELRYYINNSINDGNLVKIIVGVGLYIV